MKYDFVTFLNRRGKDALALDAVGKSPFGPSAPKEGFDLIPMWIADMNFPVPPSVQEAIIKRAEHPAFGYFLPRDEYYEAIISWQKERHNTNDLRWEDIGYENGVLGGVVSALNVLCQKGDPVLLQSPTYIGFTSALQNNGYQIVLNPMKIDKKGVWRMDFEDMEKKIKDFKIHACVFCSPHNPTGRVWEKSELQRMVSLFEKYEVSIVSDEIWSDIIVGSKVHIPLQSVNSYTYENTVSLFSPSKTFNLAGLVGSYRIVRNKTLKRKLEKQASLSHYNSMNLLSMYALIGAYTKEGALWLDELCQVLANNLFYGVSFIRKNFPGVQVCEPEGTYMLFIDCKEFCQKKKLSFDKLYKAGCEVGVGWQDGRPFHGEYSIRMNLALPFAKVQEAFSRLQDHVFGRL